MLRLDPQTPRLRVEPASRSSGSGRTQKMQVEVPAHRRRRSARSSSTATLQHPGRRAVRTAGAAPGPVTQYRHRRRCVITGRRRGRAVPRRRPPVVRRVRRRPRRTADDRPGSRRRTDGRDRVRTRRDQAVEPPSDRPDGPRRRTAGREPLLLQRGDGRRHRRLPGPRLRAQRGHLAAAIGTRLTADTFTVANTVPNIIYILLAGGVLNAVFVPQLVRAMKNGADGGEGYTDRLLTLAGLVLLRRSPSSATLAAPLLIGALHRRRLHDAGRRTSRRVRVLVPAADLLLRRLHDARPGAQRPRQLRPDDVGARSSTTSWRSRRRCSFIALFTVDPDDPASLRPAASRCSAAHHPRRRRAGARARARAAAHRLPLPARASTSAATGWAGPATWPSGRCCSCWSTSSPTSSSSTSATRRRDSRPPTAGIDYGVGFTAYATPT